DRSSLTCETSKVMGAWPWYSMVSWPWASRSHPPQNSRLTSATRLPVWVLSRLRRRESGRVMAYVSCACALADADSASQDYVTEPHRRALAGSAMGLGKWR